MPKLDNKRWYLDKLRFKLRENSYFDWEHLIDSKELDKFVEVINRLQELFPN
jgi:hypothetical protein